MSETFGDKMAGNYLKKIGWYLKSSIHGHPRKKKGKKKFERVNRSKRPFVTLLCNQTLQYMETWVRHLATKCLAIVWKRSGDI